MWGLYIQGSEGVAIQSTFARLRDSFSKCREYSIYIGEVAYIDFENELMTIEGSHYAYLFKRKSFEHEHELRAIIQSIPKRKRGKNRGKYNFHVPLCDDGLKVHVCLDTLIDRIYLPPTSPKWKLDLVISLPKRYKLSKEVHQSSLYEKGNIVF